MGDEDDTRFHCILDTISTPRPYAIYTCLMYCMYYTYVKISQNRFVGRYPKISHGPEARSTNVALEAQAAFLWAVPHGGVDHQTQPV